MGEYRGKSGNFPFRKALGRWYVYGWCRTSVILSGSDRVLDYILRDLPLGCVTLATIAKLGPTT